MTPTLPSAVLLGVLPVLQWEVAGGLLEEAFRSLFDDLGALPARLPSSGRFLRRVRGRAALDLRVLTAVAGQLPGGSADEVERQAAAVAQVVAAAPPPDRLETPALLGYRARLLDLAARAVRAEVAVAAAAVTGYHQLETTLARPLGPEAAAGWAQELTARAGADVVRRRQDRLPEVPADLRDVLQDDWSTARDRLAVSCAGRGLLARFHRAWAQAGSMAVLAGPTWAEAPDLAWAWARTPGWQTRRVLTGQVVDVRASLLRRAVADARELLDRRERARR